VDSLAATLHRALALDVAARRRMREACLAQARGAFLPSSHAESLGQLVAKASGALSQRR